jgi:TPP-dependent pyruvate/acetoin dehydrogenase alpha subunit
VQSARTDILAAFKRAERELKPKITELFNDVYDELPIHLVEQACPSTRPPPPLTTQ